MGEEGGVGVEGKEGGQVAGQLGQVRGGAQHRLVGDDRVEGVEEVRVGEEQGGHEQAVILKLHREHLREVECGGHLVDSHLEVEGVSDTVSGPGGDVVPALAGVNKVVAHEEAGVDLLQGSEVLAGELVVVLEDVTNGLVGGVEFLEGLLMRTCIHPDAELQVSRLLPSSPRFSSGSCCSRGSSPWRSTTGGSSVGAWSCVEKMLKEDQVTLAPSSMRVLISTAVWMVMWRQLVILAPWRALEGPYFCQRYIRPDISFSARVSSFLPQSAWGP